VSDERGDASLRVEDTIEAARGWLLAMKDSTSDGLTPGGRPRRVFTKPVSATAAVAALEGEMKDFLLGVGKSRDFL